MSRYRILTTVTASLFEVFTTNTAGQPAPTATDIFVVNTDGTVTHIVGAGLALSGGVATAGTVTSITRTNAAGTVTFDVADQTVAANNSFVSFWNAANNTARFNYATTQGDQGSGSSGADNINLGTGDNDFTGYAGNDVFTGNTGFDFLSYAAEMATTYPGTATAITAGTQGVIVNLSGATVSNITVTGGTFTVLASQAKDSYGDTDTFSSMEGASGTFFSDALFGNGSNNVFRPYGGNDFIDGGAGTDEYSAVAASSTNPLFIPTTGITVTYSAGTSFDGTVSIDGFGGVDTLVSIERIRGSQLADTVTGNDANNLFRGLGGNDTFSGGAGADEADYSRDVDYSGAVGVIVNLSGANISATIAAGTFNVGFGQARDGFGAIDTLNSVDNIIGTAQGDYIVGSAWDNNLNGGNGNDTIIGGLGFDFITPGSGADVINGTAPGPFPGSGDQSYADRQEVFYGDGNNGIGVAVNFSNVALNNVSVGGVASPFTLAALTGRDWSGSIDTYIDIERVRGTASADFFRGSDTANLRQERFNGGGGADTIDGGAGIDQVRYNNDGGTAGVIVNLSAGSVIATISTGSFTVLAGQARDGTGATDTLISIEQVIGSNNSDYLAGSSERNNFRMLGGNDTVDGGAGDDSVSIYVDDTFNIAGGIVDLAASTATGLAGGVSLLTSIEDAEGSEGNDTLIGSAGDNYLYGGAGNDVIDGGVGDDIVSGSSGNNTLSGGAGLDDALSYLEDPGNGEQLNRQFPVFFPTPWAGVTVSLLGGTATHHAGGVDSVSGFENVIGSFFNDNITGDGGNNGFDGLSGNDTIDGGAGTDTVYYGLWDSQGRTSPILPGINASNPNGVIVDLQAGTANDGEGGTDTLISIENVIGSNGADNITGRTGSNSDNVLQGGAGADTLDGGGGAGIDTVNYSDSELAVSVVLNTSAFGGDAQGDVLSGFENVTGSFNADNLTGDGGDNVIQGDDGGDTLAGGSGNDTVSYERSDPAVTVTINGAASGGHAQGDLISGFENLRGGRAGDTLTGDGSNNVIEGGEGGDTLAGGNGNDTVSYEHSDLAVTVTINGAASGGHAQGDLISGFENLRGGRAGDTLTGDGSNNVIEGGEGGDTLVGGGGSDTAGYEHSKLAVAVAVNGAAAGGDAQGDTLSGFTSLRGSAFNDKLTGDGAGNSLDGGDGNDTLRGGVGNDTIAGGAGTGDMMDLSDAAGAVNVTLGAGGSGTTSVLGTDTYSGIEGVIGGNSADTLTGNSDGNIFAGGLGSDVINGGGGTDTSDMTSSVTWDVGYAFGSGSTVYLTNGTESDSLTSVERLIFGSGVDFVYSDNTLALDGGIGVGGNDANYLLMFGAGPFTVHLDTAQVSHFNLIYLGAGADTVDVAGSTYAYLYGLGGSDTMTTGTAGGYIYAGDGDDTLSGAGSGIDQIYGEAGNDVINGLGGDDGIYAGVDNDSINGGDGNDLIFGEAGNDTLIGGNGNDLLLAQDGADSLVFDAGTDIGVGGIGADVFAWTSYTQGADIIADFSHAEGDKLEFDHTTFGVAAGTNLVLGVSFFVGAGTAPTTATPTVYFDTTSTILWFDLDGTGAAAGQAVTFLSGGSGGLTASDIIFT